MGLLRKGQALRMYILMDRKRLIYVYIVIPAGMPNRCVSSGGVTVA